MLKRIPLLALAILTLFPVRASEKPEPPVVKISVSRFYNPNLPNNPTTKALIELMRKNPNYDIRAWGGISLPTGIVASLMMALAGGTAPDLGLGMFHTIGNDIKQNFLYPLNEWIGEDTDGNGIIDDHEVKWKQWLTYRPLWRKIVTVNGKIYGIPVPLTSMYAIVFRTDMAKAAGLDPNAPPKDWDELYEWCKKLTDPDKDVKGAMFRQGQRAIALHTQAWMFLPWFYSAGADPFIQIKKSPTTGREYQFSMTDTVFKTPEGEDLEQQPSVWKVNWDTPEGLSALAFFHKLRWGKWKNGDTEITGVARMASGQRGDSALDLLGRGEVAMLMSSVDDLSELGSSAKLDPSLLSWFPIPAAPTPKGKRIVECFQHYIVMYAGVANRPKAERDAIWETLKAAVSPDILLACVQSQALSGLSRFTSPELLKRAGFDEYLRDVPRAIRRSFAEVESGEVKSVTEPFVGYWPVVGNAFSRQVLDILLGANGEDFDYKTALKEVQRQANSGIMYDIPKETLDKYRNTARVVTALIILIMATFLFKIIQSYRIRGKGGSRSVYTAWLPVLLLLPALLIITCWKYYPLLRGMLMAFQDYKIVGESKFVGLDNFITLAMDNSFWMSILRTFYYVFLNMTIAFLAPIILAILLTEVPRGKIFFRTLFFLPQMTSGIVIALMWKLMYEPTPAGFFNQLIEYLNYLPFVNIGTQTWLEDPDLAMLCCIIPSVWAGMGMASLIYLAALHSLPRELYEAAEVDGAGFFRKLFSITIPYLLPLIVINFVGAFIGTFQSMGNIFLMTFGGPGEATMVVGLKIWQEAYVNLRFSMATSMAWIMGAGLIGLTYLQIQFLKKVEYKKASE